jgi:two-component system, OmpR family, phosphate regulon sensor histidine kinase PhoR
MLPSLRRVAGFAVAFALPGWLVLAGLGTFGLFSIEAAIAAGLAVLAVSVVVALPFATGLGRALSAIETLGKEAAPAVESRSTRTLFRLDPAARALWPALSRLGRAWRERSERAEARAAAAEAVIAAAPDPVILIDRERRIVRANPAATAFIGTVAGPRDLAAALRNPALLAAAEAVLRGEAAQSVQFAVSVPVARQLEARFARIPRSEAAALDGAAAILTLHDVTALRRAEQMRADFIANAGHELKTPLATLIGFIETLLGPAKDDAEARQRFLSIMREEASRMARLVDDLRSLTRIEQREHMPPTGRVALAPLIQHVAAALELRAGERGIRIGVDLSAELPEVQGERDELTQLFQNLLDNAIKYGRPQSEIAITGEVGMAGPGSLVRVAVADQGDGIPHEHLPRLTERFYRVDSARSRELGATGLGLAIVKHIINRHRGRLEVSSKLGVGSTFTVWLPAAPLDARSGSREDPAAVMQR